MPLSNEELVTNQKVQEIKPTPPIQKIIAVMWPSFLISGISTIAFFTLFDPVEILHLHLSREGAYSIGFFLFWLVTISSSLLTLYFQLPPPYIPPSPLSNLDIDEP